MSDELPTQISTWPPRPAALARARAELREVAADVVRQRFHRLPPPPAGAGVLGAMLNAVVYRVATGAWHPAARKVA